MLVLSEYGDLRYVEMSMESMSILDFATTQTDLGHRHFKSWYFSATEAVTDGDLGVDNMGHSMRRPSAGMLLRDFAFQRHRLWALKG